MKHRFSALLAALLLVGAVQARADDAWHAFGSLDYLAPGSAGKQTTKAADSLCKTVIAAGFAKCSYTSATDGAVGFRVGALKEMSGVMIGPSLGYLYGGPNVSGKINFTTTPAGTFEYKQSNHTVRLLGEVQKAIPFSEAWSANFGAGLGMAVDANRITCTDSGALAGSCAGVARSKSFGWATWELSSSLAYRSAFLGLRYAGFSRGRENPWNTFGLFAGYHL